MLWLTKKTNYQRTQGMVGAPCCLVNRGQPLSSKLLRSGIAAGQGSRFMNGKMLGLVIVIPVDGRNLKNQLIGPVVYPIVYMVCLILLFSSTNSDLPFIHVICWLVILVLPCSRCWSTSYLPFCDLRSQQCCFVMSSPQCKGFVREICQDWLGLFMISFEVGEKV